MIPGTLHDGIGRGTAVMGKLRVKWPWICAATLLEQDNN